MNDPQLDRLLRLAIESGSTEFWLNALPWLVEATGAAGGSIVLVVPEPGAQGSGRGL